MKFRKTLMLFFLFNAMGTVWLYPQAARIDNVRFYFEKSSSQVIVTYDLVDFSEFELYDIELTFNDGMNIIIIPKTVSGDTGSNLTGGNNKKITWDIFNDVGGISETAVPVVKIIAVRPIPVDPSLALIMNKIDKSSKSRYKFTFRRDGMMIIGVGAGISAIVLKIKADNYIDKQSMASNADEYNLYGDKAKTCYTFSWITGGLSVVCTGYAVYQYIRGDKPGSKKHAFWLSPGQGKGVLMAWRYNF